ALSADMSVNRLKGLPSFPSRSTTNAIILFTIASFSTPRGRQIKRLASSMHSTSGGSFMPLCRRPFVLCLHASLILRGENPPASFRRQVFPESFIGNDLHKSHRKDRVPKRPPSDPWRPDSFERP